MGFLRLLLDVRGRKNELLLNPEIFDVQTASCVPHGATVCFQFFGGRVPLEAFPHLKEITHPGQGQTCRHITYSLSYLLLTELLRPALGDMVQCWDI